MLPSENTTRPSPTSEADKHKWTAALVSFDYCDPNLLAAMIENEPVPVELRSVISAIIKGARRPNMRAGAKSKVPAAERFQIGATVGAMLETIADMKHPAITENYANENGVEPKDAIIRLNRYIDQVYNLATDRLEVSRETVENIVREWRKNRAKWPDV
jgi:hypothetical protein